MGYDMEVILFVLLTLLFGYACFVYGYKTGVMDTRARISQFGINNFSLCCKFWIIEALDHT